MDESLRKFIPFLISTVIVPAGLTAMGISLLIVFSIGLLLTLCVAIRAYPNWSTALLIALIPSGAFAAWTVKREEGYELKFQFCRNQTNAFIDGVATMKMYALGLRVFNDSAFDLWSRLDEQSFTLAKKAAEAAPPAPPMRVRRGTRNFAAWSTIDFEPPIPLTEVKEGHIRYVFRYGRDPDHLTKAIIVSGKIIPIFLQDGDTRLDFQPDRDSDIPDDLTEICRLPEN